MKLVINKVYTKSELSSIYGVSWKTILRMIKRTPELLQQLKESGYRNKQKILTPLQVSIIHKYFSPEDKLNL